MNANPTQTRHQYPDRKVFLGGLAWSINESSLQQYLENDVGVNVEKVIIMRDRKTGNSRGFGFVILKDPDQIDIVVNTVHILDGKKIEAKKAIPKDEIQESNTRKLFVGGIPVNINDEDFKIHFEQYGEVAEIQIVKDRHTGKSRGFGFVTFEDKDTVDKVLAEQHNLLGKYVEVKKAEPKKTPNDQGDIYITFPNANIPLSEYGNIIEHGAEFYTPNQLLPSIIDYSQDPNGYFPNYPAYEEDFFYDFIPPQANSNGRPLSPINGNVSPNSPIIGRDIEEQINGVQLNNNGRSLSPLNVNRSMSPVTSGRNLAPQTNNNGRSISPVNRNIRSNPPVIGRDIEEQINGVQLSNGRSLSPINGNNRSMSPITSGRNLVPQANINGRSLSPVNGRSISPQRSLHSRVLPLDQTINSFQPPNTPINDNRSLSTLRNFRYGNSFTNPVRKRSKSLTKSDNSRVVGSNIPYVPYTPQNQYESNSYDANLYDSNQTFDSFRLYSTPQYSRPFHINDGAKQFNENRLFSIKEKSENEDLESSTTTFPNYISSYVDYSPQISAYEYENSGNSETYSVLESSLSEGTNYFNKSSKRKSWSPGFTNDNYPVY